MVEAARNAFLNGKTKSLEFREIQLKNLLRLYTENEKRILQALEDDIRKVRHISG